MNQEEYKIGKFGPDLGLKLNRNRVVVDEQLAALPQQAFITFTDNGTVTVLESKGITSIVRDGLGTYTITFSSAFRSANSYVPSGVVNQGSDSQQITYSERYSTPATATTYTFYTAHTNSSLVNAYRCRMLFTEI